jgi:Ca-activated chloride channel family protein
MPIGLVRLCLLLAVFGGSASTQFAVPSTPSTDPPQPTRQFRADDPVLRERTGLVTLTVTVTDRARRPVVGLRREQFEVYEDKVLQQIEFFREADAPASIAVVFDVSGSMEGKLARAREALKSFVETSHPQDEYFLIAFNERATLRAAAADGDDLVRIMQNLTPSGGTALYDAVFLGLDTLKQARHAKHALVVITDGADNRSRYSFGELRRYVRESDTQIYCVGINDAVSLPDQVNTQRKLEELARPTGGNAFFPESLAELEQIASTVAVELRRQYSIGYVPTARVSPASGTQRDAQWRKIMLRVKPESGQQGEGRLTVRTRAGYYTMP